MQYDQQREELAHNICREFEQLANERVNFESHWLEIAQRIKPADERLFNSQGSDSTKGDKRNEHVFDSTAAVALKRFGAIMDSLLTPRDSKWHHLRPSSRILAKNRQVMMWFEDVNDLLFKYRYAAAANFAGQNQQNYLNLGAYGSGCMFTDALMPTPTLKARGLRYKSVSLNEIFFAENHQGIVDKAYRRFNPTGRQLLQKWPEKIPDNIKEKIAKNPEMTFQVLHVVRPRENYDPNRKDFRGMPFASLYILREGKIFLEEGGYSSFPYAIPRYEQANGEVYGRGPAADVLPAVKTLNEQKKTVLKQGHRAVDPVLLAHDDGILDGFNLTPGAVNYGGVDSQGRPLVHVLPTGNIAIGKELMDDERAVINDAFLSTIFQILTETPAMTATEVLERTREKGILLAPTVGRQQTEYLGPLIDRELDVLSQQGLLPPMPRMLLEAKGEYTIEYDSPITRAAKAEEASGIMRTVETAINIANSSQDMTIFHHFNFDVILPEIAQIQGVPLRWMNDPQTVAKLRQQSAQNAQDEKMIQAAPAAAAMMKAQAVAGKAPKGQ